MIFSYLVFLACAVGVYALMARFGLLWRVIVAAAVFFVPSFLFTVWVSSLEDTPQEGAVTITPESKDMKNKGEKP